MIFIISALGSSPIILIFVSLYLWIAFKFQKYYMGFLRESSRIRGVASSPVIQAFKEGIEGVSTIRIHGNQDQFFKNYLDAIDGLQINNICTFAARNWFKLRISAMSLFVVVPCILISVRKNSFYQYSR